MPPQPDDGDPLAAGLVGGGADACAARGGVEVLVDGLVALRGHRRERLHAGVRVEPVNLGEQGARVRGQLLVVVGVPCRRLVREAAAGDQSRSQLHRARLVHERGERLGLAVAGHVTWGAGGTDEEHGVVADRVCGSVAGALKGGDQTPAGDVTVGGDVGDAEGQHVGDELDLVPFVDQAPEVVATT